MSFFSYKACFIEAYVARRRRLASSRLAASDHAPMATLIESITAMAVFAIGASSSAAWVAQASARSTGAGQRLRALAIATDMEARLRANPAAVDAGDYRYAIPARLRGGPVGRPGVSVMDIAADDLARFRADIQRELGTRARGDVRCGAGRCTVALRWPGGGLDWHVAP